MCVEALEGGGYYGFECRPVIMAYLVSMCCSMPYCEGNATGVLHSGTSDGTALVRVGRGGRGRQHVVRGDAMCAGDVKVP